VGGFTPLSEIPWRTVMLRRESRSEGSAASPKCEQAPVIFFWLRRQQPRQEACRETKCSLSGCSSSGQETVTADQRCLWHSPCWMSLVLSFSTWSRATSLIGSLFSFSHPPTWEQAPRKPCREPPWGLNFMTTSSGRILKGVLRISVLVSGRILAF